MHAFKAFVVNSFMRSDSDMERFYVLRITAIRIYI